MKNENPLTLFPKTFISGCKNLCSINNRWQNFQHLFLAHLDHFKISSPGIFPNLLAKERKQTKSF